MFAGGRGCQFRRRHSAYGSISKAAKSLWRAGDARHFRRNRFAGIALRYRHRPVDESTGITGCCKLRGRGAHDAAYLAAARLWCADIYFLRKISSAPSHRCRPCHMWATSRISSPASAHSLRAFATSARLDVLPRIADLPASRHINFLCSDTHYAADAVCGSCVSLLINAIDKAYRFAEDDVV